MKHIFFYLFNDFIGGADNDQYNHMYKEWNLNSPAKRHAFIERFVAPAYRNNFDETQKSDLAEYLDLLLEKPASYLKEDIEDQMFPFDFPDDLKEFYGEIMKALAIK